MRIDKSILLLSYLALNIHRPQQRDVIAEALWPDQDIEHARNTFRVTLSRLRRLFSAPDVLLSEGGTLRINPERLSCDVTRFRQLLTRARRAAPEQRPTLLADALTGYGGPLLRGVDEIWAFAERQVLEEECLRARSELAHACLQNQDWDGALAQWRLALELDPLHEDIHAALIRTYRSAGRNSDALTHFQEATRLLQNKGLPPSSRLKAALDEPSHPAQPLARPPATREIPALPLDLTRCFGRDEEIQRLTQLLHSPGVRLITLVGTGGVGKTRLALEAARSLEPHQTIHWVPLAEHTDAERLPETILTILGLSESAAPGAPLQRLAAELNHRRGVLLLDNLEHLAEAPVTALLALLLKQAPELTILATSRRRIGLSAERVLLVAPLPAPGEEDLADTLEQTPSVALFVDRARLLQPDFALTPENRAAVALLCRALDGLPLAIEMAAARIPVLTPNQIAARIARQGHLLVNRNKDVTPRHLSLRTALEWSYALLPTASQRFLRHLSVFRGGWSLEAAEAVCDAPDALEALTELRDASLVVADIVEIDSQPETRYRLLETVRQFLDDRLDPTERQELEARHTEWCLTCAEAILQLGGRAHTERRELEYENLYSALLRPAPSLIEPRRVRLVQTLHHQWWSHPLETTWTQHIYPIFQELRSGAEHTESIQMLLWAYVRRSINAAHSRSDVDETLFALFERAPLPIQRLGGLQLRSALHMTFGAAEDIRHWLQAMVEQAGLSDLERRVGLVDLGWFLGREGRFDEACPPMREAMTISRTPGEEWWVAITECMLAYLELRRGNPAAARALYDAGATHLKARRDDGTLSMMHSIDAYLLRAEGHPRPAVRIHREHVSAFFRQDPREAIFSIQGLAECALTLDQPELALWLLGVYQGLETQMRLYFTPFERQERAELGAQARAAGAPEGVWEAAVALPFDDALALLEEKTRTLL